MKLRLSVFREDEELYKRFGAVSRKYLERFKVSNSLMKDKDFSHDWLTEFYWKSLDADHDLAEGLRNVMKNYDFLKRGKVVIGGEAGEALGDRTREISEL